MNLGSLGGSARHGGRVRGFDNLVVLVPGRHGIPARRHNVHMKIAAVQMVSTPDVARNLETAARLIQ